MIRTMWFVAAIMGCAVLWFCTDLPWRGNVLLPEPKPDAIATSSAVNGNILIRNETAGYRVTIPETWYLEKSAGSGMAIYSDRGATDLSAPECKVEISMFTNASAVDISSWLMAYLRRDPTIDIIESSREVVPANGASEMVWSGTLNGVSTTLGYIASGTAVYEIAPSVIAKVGDGLAPDMQCMNAFRSVLSSFTITKK